MTPLNDRNTYMSNFPKALWLNVSPSFKVFDQPLLRYLSRQTSIARWEYCQTQDEASSLDMAIVLLHDYIKTHPYPVHLIGHGTSGLVGLLYARRYPERVASLTLLAVGAQPAADWQAFYHAHLNFLPCSRTMVLRQMAHSLFGLQSSAIIQSIVGLLEADLRCSPSPHTLIHQATVAAGGCKAPMLVCGSEDDSVISPHEFQEWQNWLGDRDVLWQCPDGRHFFHYSHPKLVGRRILSFWAGLVADLPQVPLTAAVSLNP